MVVPLALSTAARAKGLRETRPRWTIGHSVRKLLRTTTTLQVPDSTRGAPCLWHETQGRRFRNPDTWCDARRNRHSRSTSEALDGGLATGSGLVGRNTAAAANLHWCAQNNGNQYRSQWNGITGAIHPIFIRHMAPAHRSDYAIPQLLTEPPRTGANCNIA